MPKQKLKEAYDKLYALWVYVEEEVHEIEDMLHEMETDIDELMSGPDNERGAVWFANDGIDCRTVRPCAA